MVLRDKLVHLEHLRFRGDRHKMLKMSKKKKRNVHRAKLNKMLKMIKYRNVQRVIINELKENNNSKNLLVSLVLTIRYLNSNLKRFLILLYLKHNKFIF